MDGQDVHPVTEDAMGAALVAFTAVLTPICLCNLGAAIVLSATLARGYPGLYEMITVLGTSFAMSIFGLIASVIINGLNDPSQEGGGGDLLLGASFVGIASLLGASISAALRPRCPSPYMPCIAGIIVATVGLIAGLVFVSEAPDEMSSNDEYAEEGCSVHTIAAMHVGSWASLLGAAVGVVPLLPSLLPAIDRNSANAKVWPFASLITAGLLCLDGFITFMIISKHAAKFEEGRPNSVSAHTGLAHECAGIVAGFSFAIAGFAASRLAAAGRTDSEQPLWVFAGLGMCVGPVMISMFGLIVCLILASSSMDRGAKLCASAETLNIISPVLRLFAIPFVGICVFVLNCKFTEMLRLPRASQSRFLNDGTELQPRVVLPGT